MGDRVQSARKAMYGGAWFPDAAAFRIRSAEDEVGAGEDRECPPAKRFDLDSHLGLGFGGSAKRLGADAPRRACRALAAAARVRRRMHHQPARDETPASDRLGKG